MMENIFDNFLWKGKTPKFKKSIIANREGEGGLQYPNLKHSDKVLKISWFKRLYNSNAGWTTFPLKYNLNLVYIFGDRYRQRIHDNINDKFWKDTLSAFIEVENMYSPKLWECKLSIPIWFSSRTMEGKMESWVEKGLLNIGDIID